MIFLVVLFILIAKCICVSETADIDYLDGFINGFYDEDVEKSDVDYSNNINEEQPKLQDEKWYCGDCVNLSSLTKLYQEEYSIEFRDSLQIYNQVELDIEGMQCITILGKQMQDLEVKRVSGACSGNFVNLEVITNGVSGATFTVEVYGI